MREVLVIIPCAVEHRATLDRAIESAYAAGAHKVDFVSDVLGWGVSGARNYAIHENRADLILPLDADDELLPGSVDMLLEAYQTGTAVYGDYVVNDAIVKNADPGMIYRKSVCHATVLFSKFDWLAVGGYKPEFNVGCEDWEFLLSLVDAGVKLIHVNAPVYRKTINPNGRAAKCLERRPLIAALLREYHPKVML